MNRRNMHIGPGAASLMLIVVVLSMSVLGILTLANAQNDIRLSMRSKAVIEEIYRLNDAAECSMAELDAAALRAAQVSADDESYLAAIEAALPGGMSLEEGGAISWMEQGADGRLLACTAVLNRRGDFPRLEWTRRQLMTEYEGME